MTWRSPIRRRSSGNQQNTHPLTAAVTGLDAARLCRQAAADLHEEGDGQ